MKWPANILAFISIRKNALALIFVLNLLLHLPFFNLPPQGTHVWRQCNTLAVARNFYEEDMNILKPRVDRRGTSDGVTGMQFPLYEYGLACVYKITGEHFWAHRLYSFIITCIGLLFFYLLLSRIFNPFIAFAGAWGLCWSPELYYHGINALPDILALSASVAGAYYFTRWRDERTLGVLTTSLICLTIAGLVKLQFLAIGAPIAFIVLRDAYQRKITSPTLLLLAGYGAVAVGIPILWYKHANNMIAQSGLADFGIHTEPVSSISALLNTVQHNLISDLPEVLLNYAGFVLFLSGIISFFKQKEMRSKFLLPALCWLGVLGVYYVMLSARFAQHAYYFIAFLPLLIIAVAIGANWLKEKGFLTILLLLLIAQPILAVVRIVPARWVESKTAVPVELYNETTRNALQNAVPKDAVCLVGPDVSGCIFYYYLHKKGFGFDSYQALKSPTASHYSAIEEAVSKGAQYLITNSDSVKTDISLSQYYYRIETIQGNFAVIKLQQP